MFNYFVYIFLFLFTQVSLGAIIIKTKGSKALIDLEGENTQVGTNYNALDLYGNKKGIIKIEKFKSGKAIGRLVSGEFGTNWILEKIKDSKFENLKSPNLLKAVNFVKKSGAGGNIFGISLNAGLNMNALHLQSSQTKNSYYGFSHLQSLNFDFPIWKSTGLKVGIGQNKFFTVIPNCSSDCVILQVSYIEGSLLFKYQMKGFQDIHPWLGLKGSLLWGLEGSAQIGEAVVRETAVGLHGHVSPSLGADLRLGSWYIPFQIDIFSLFLPTKGGTYAHSSHFLVGVGYFF